MSRWNEILFNCSIQLLQLLLSFTTTNYKQIVNEISDIINNSNISRDDLPIIKRRLADIEKIELSKHKEKQRNKFQRDKIHTVYLNQDMNDINTTNHKVPRKRKFKRRKQKTESIVVNLSSKELTRAEESLLSVLCHLPNVSDNNLVWLPNKTEYRYIDNITFDCVGELELSNPLAIKIDCAIDEFDETKGKWKGEIPLCQGNREQQFES
ncbi:unnamed protein product [Mytilus coruscus]|uniref:Sushi domain-containing protein n=1 Tax=Mytilus coruscus TaxID=42192 RepID=A0A6J8AX05_MYTCO|nr:unnamed protein product [Mytilus coruscus]